MDLGTKGPKTQKDAKWCNPMDEPKYKSKYKKTFPLRAKKLARDMGYSNARIAKELGVTPATFQKWVKSKKTKYKPLRLALRKGRDERRQKDKRAIERKKLLKTVESFPEYVYRKLDPTMQAYWDEINEFENAESGVQKVEALLKKGGEFVRMSMFVHSLIVSGFRINQALQKANVSRKTFKRWEKDPQFLQLLQDIDWYKGNFIEDSLMSLIQMRDTSAIIHASKTFNKSRGYGDKLEIEDTTVPENPFDKLPLALKKQIRDELQKQKTKSA